MKTRIEAITFDLDYLPSLQATVVEEIQESVDDIPTYDWYEPLDVLPTILVAKTEPTYDWYDPLDHLPTTLVANTEPIDDWYGPLDELVYDPQPVPEELFDPERF